MTPKNSENHSRPRKTSERGERSRLRPVAMVLAVTSRAVVGGDGHQ